MKKITTSLLCCPLVVLLLFVQAKGENLSTVSHPPILAGIWRGTDLTGNLLQWQFDKYGRFQSYAKTLFDQNQIVYEGSWRTEGQLLFLAINTARSRERYTSGTYVSYRNTRPFTKWIRIQSLTKGELILRASEEGEGLIQFTKTSSAERWRPFVIYKDNAKDIIAPDVTLFLDLLNDPDRKVREYAVKAMGYLKDDKAIEPLRKILYEDNDRLVAMAAAGALAKIGSGDALAVLTNALTQPSAYVQEIVASYLGKKGGRQTVLALLEIVKNGKEDQQLRSDAIVILGQIGDLKAAETLREVLLDNDEDWNLRVRAAVALGVMKDQEAFEALVQTWNVVKFKDGFQNYRGSWTFAFSKLGNKRAIPLLLADLPSQNNPDKCREGVCFDIITALGELQATEAVAPLSKVIYGEGIFKNAGENLTQAAASSLAKIGGIEAEDALIWALENRREHNNMRSNVAWMLGKMHSEKAALPLRKILLDKGENCWARNRAAQGLGAIHGQDSFDVLQVAWREGKGLEGTSCYLTGVAFAFGELGDKRATTMLIDGLSMNNDWKVQEESASALGKLKSSEAVGPLSEIIFRADLIKNPQALWLREKITSAIAAIGGEDARNILTTALKDPWPEVRDIATKALLEK